MEQVHMGAELLADEIAQKIREKIQNQEYNAGERLTVRKLCEEYGASETPVKQALNQLVTTGLVVSVPKCGMRVRTFEFQDMKNIWEARIMIEQYCAASAVERARRDEGFVQYIQSILAVSNEEYEKCSQDFSKENFMKLHKHDSALHTAMVQCCQNDLVIDMYQSLNTHAGMFTGFNYHTPESLREVQKQHSEIVNQLVMCSVDGVKKAVEQHIYSTIQIYRAGWTKEHE